jgi:enolase-phosphatase E1
MAVYVYSSGSLQNQLDWFSFAEGGSLAQTVDGYFDLTTAGGKQGSVSYRRITEQIGVASTDTTFLSDSPAELDAAAAAGWQVIGVAREPASRRHRCPHTAGSRRLPP